MSNNLKANEYCEHKRKSKIDGMCLDCDEDFQKVFDVVITIKNISAKNEEEAIEIARGQDKGYATAHEVKY